MKQQQIRRRPSRTERERRRERCAATFAEPRVSSDVTHVASVDDVIADIDATLASAT